MKLLNKFSAVVMAMIISVGSCFFVQAEDEMRGVWVSTVSNLDYPSTRTTDSEVLKQEAIKILDNCQDLGFNAIFLQVRPASDAFYKSEIFPWSQWLTGSQGTAPDNDFDPLTFWVNEAHKRGMELHAWINPYRITTNGIPLSNLANNNPARIHPEYTVKYSNGNYYYNPAIPEVRQLLIDGLMEIVNNYDVDGIHMDDYFYPGSEFDDAKSFSEYSRGFENLEDWRRDNVNLLIKGIRDELDKNGKNVEFGISPCGIWANKAENPLGSDTNGYQSYYAIYADTRKWALENWIDYIAPQIYWEIGHSLADYATLADWWSETLKDSPTKLYIGIGDYRCDGAESSSVWYNGSAIEKQLNYNKNISKISGVIHFRYGSIMNNSALYSLIKAENTGKTIIQEQTVETTRPNVIQEQTVETTKPAVIQEPTVEATTADVNVILNNEKLVFDQPPIIENGRTLVPMRTIFEALGAEVNWDGENNKVTAKSGNTVIGMTIGKNTMTINSTTFGLDTAPKIVGSRTLVPLRAVSEAFDAQVDWNSTTRTVTIKTK